MRMAFYMRLSVADGDLGKDRKDESNSIENQRILLKNYVDSCDELDGEICEYIDDGYTGTNFERPGFLRMLEDAKMGKIDAILVKDLSRLGRDYIGVGDYMEQIFPVLGIRFIAVNSYYDSKDYAGRTMGLETSVMNLVNSYYSKDASKKQKTALQAKWKRGITTTGRVPFGYIFDKNSRGYMRVDPVASKYVRFIFEKAMEGLRTSEIAAALNELGVPTPGRYRVQLGEKETGERKVSDEEWIWDTRKVWSTLLNQTYTGAMVHGKTRRLHIASKESRSVPESKWFVVKDAHEAIVSEEEFREAQSCIKRLSHPQGMAHDRGYSLRGKVACGNCGLSMSYDETAYKATVVCAHARATGGTAACPKTRYDAKRIETAVLFALKQQLGAMDTMLPEVRAKKKSLEECVEGGRKQAAEELEQLKAERVRQYEAYADGVTSREQYIRKKQDLADRIRCLQDKEGRIGDILDVGGELLDRTEGIIKQGKDVKKANQLTREMAEIFIDKVLVHDGMRLDIRFSFEDVLARAMEYVTEGRQQDGTD